MESNKILMLYFIGPIILLTYTSVLRLSISSADPRVGEGGDWIG